MPLVWSVSDPARGIIRASGGLTAVYEGKNVAGNNTTTVRDQGENSGIAVVIHLTGFTGRLKEVHQPSYDIAQRP